MSDYRLLLDRTSDVLVTRAKNFRDLVVSFVVIGLLSNGGMVAVMDLRPVFGLLLLVPACANFLWSDHRILRGWRQQLGEAWVGRRMDFSAFRHALDASPVMPRMSIRAMLATLPDAGDLQYELTAEAGTRRAVFGAMMARDDCHAISLACRAAAYGLVAVAIIGSVMLWTWEPGLALVSVLVLPAACTFLRRRRIVYAVQATLKLTERSDFDAERYREILASFDWHDVPPGDRERLIFLC